MEYIAIPAGELREQPSCVQRCKRWLWLVVAAPVILLLFGVWYERATASAAITASFLEEPGNEVPPCCNCRSSKFYAGFNSIALELARDMGLSIQRSPSGNLVLVGQGCFGRLYALSNGQVMKVQKGRVEPEAVLGSNVPLTPYLVRAERWTTRRDAGGASFCGMVMRRINGFPGTDYPSSRRLSSAQAIVVASDLAIALHAMHTKIRGYVALHCDIHPSAKNVMIVEDPLHAVLIDYGSSLVDTLQSNENPYEHLFMHRIYGCHKTETDGWTPTPGPFNVSADWRELGLAIYGLMADPNKIYDGRNQTCDDRCAATRNIEIATVSQSLKDLLFTLIVGHEGIRDEVNDVLRHPSFAFLSPPPAEVAGRIRSVVPTAEFEQTFGRRETNQLMNGQLMLSDEISSVKFLDQHTFSQHDGHERPETRKGGQGARP